MIPRKKQIKPLRKAGGGERTTLGLDGKIVSKDTISPGRESGVKDTEH